MNPLQPQLCSAFFPRQAPFNAPFTNPLQQEGLISKGPVEKSTLHSPSSSDFQETCPVSSKEEENWEESAAISWVEDDGVRWYEKNSTRWRKLEGGGRMCLVSYEPSYSGETTPYGYGEQEELDETEEKESHDIEINYKVTGADWLVEEYRKQNRGLYAAPIPTDRFCATNIYKICEKKNEWDLSKIFPKRTITAEQVQQLTTRQINKLDHFVFFSIIDLFDGEQAMKLLNWRNGDQTFMTETLVMALCFFNKSFGAAFAAAQKTIYDVPVDSRIQKAAKQAFEGYKKYSPEEMQKLMSTPMFEKIEQGQMLNSLTLTQGEDLDRNQAIKKWRKQNTKLLPGGLQTPVTAEFLIKLNASFRKSDEPKGFRKVRTEIAKIEENSYLLPSSAVESAMKEFFPTLNKQLEKCDTGEENPIVVAAYSYQKLISIHPFQNGNGRTSRSLADLILRRYGVLPVTWQENHNHISAQPHLRTQITSTIALKWLLEDLNRSYKIIKSATNESESKVAASVQSVAQSHKPKEEASASSQSSSSSASSLSSLSVVPQLKGIKRKRKK